MIYMGSKARIAKELLPIILFGREEGQYYIEPFCGGCNSLCLVDGNRIGNDKNEYLIEMWKALTSGSSFPITITRELYSEVRNSYNKRDNKYSKAEKGWIGFMGSFNGRFFDGGYSGHLVGNRNYISEQIKNTLKQIDKLKDVIWQSGEYYNIIIPDNSIIYCDPPYKNTKQYSTSRNFDYDRFYKWCIDMKSKGHKVFISEYKMPEPFACIWQREVINSLNQKITKRPIEKLFTIY